MNRNEDGSESDLLVTTFRSIYQIAKLIRKMEIDKEEKIFYSHLSLHCIRLQDCITRASQTSSQVDRNLINIALCQLSSLFTETDIQEVPSHTTEIRLKMFISHWDKIREQDDNAKIDFIKRWLKLGLPEEHLNCINNALEQCADELEKRQPEKGFMKSSVEIVSGDHDGPSYGVWRAAQALYDALLQCETCSCPDQHEYKAKLELGTYRKPRKPAKETMIPSNSRRRVPRKNSNATGALDFDMFLSTKREWHEIRVQTAKERVVGFTIDEPVKPIYDTTRLVKRLCKSINSARSKPRHRFVLKLTSGHLFNEGMEGSNFWIDQAVEPISLLRCFEEKRDVFTEKTKRILSLIIGYAVLHLSGTSWLQSAWGSRDIKFFQTVSQTTPLRPFIQVHLLKASEISGVEIDTESDDDAIVDDELNSGHRCPALIALAVVLIEIYFTNPFFKLAQTNGIPLESSDSNITIFDVDQVFNGLDDKVEGWRSQIPEDSPLLTAIDNCLNTELWEDDEGNAFDNPTLESRIYDSVVRPLELHLTTGFSKIPLDDVDNYAKGLDFGGWGQPIVNHNFQGVTTAAPPSTASWPPRSSTLSCVSPSGLTLCASNQVDTQSIVPALQRRRQHSDANTVRSLSYLDDNLGSIFQSENSRKTPQFFDDEAGDEENEIKKTRDYLRWRAEYLRVYERFIMEHLTSLRQKVKIAILDTGIDRGHDAFEAREDAIKARLNYHNGSQKGIPDSNGHGTFTASLILDYAPDAELYIIKISDENATPSAETVANAINHAIDKWDVDIVSMSFGWPSSDFNGHAVLESAIHRAFAKKVLLFAAASNSGGRLSRAYPASSSQVICVHSTDALGNASAFSPTAQRHTLNLATIGESVESAWPIYLCDDKSTPQRYVKSRSGTSYATPIMAGIAAFLLQYARIHLSAEEALKFKTKENMEALLQRCAERGPNYAMRDGYFYVELSLNRQNLFGGRLEEINYEISKTLRR